MGMGAGGFHSRVCFRGFARIRKCSDGYGWGMFKEHKDS